MSSKCTLKELELYQLMFCLSVVCIFFFQKVRIVILWRKLAEVSAKFFSKNTSIKNNQKNKGTVYKCLILLWFFSPKFAMQLAEVLYVVFKLLMIIIFSKHGKLLKLAKLQMHKIFFPSDVCW